MFLFQILTPFTYFFSVYEQNKSIIQISTNVLVDGTNTVLWACYSFGVFSFHALALFFAGSYHLINVLFIAACV